MSGVTEETELCSQPPYIYIYIYYPREEFTEETPESKEVAVVADGWCNDVQMLHRLLVLE